MVICYSQSLPGMQLDTVRIAVVGLVNDFYYRWYMKSSNQQSCLLKCIPSIMVIILLGGVSILPSCSSGDGDGDGDSDSISGITAFNFTADNTVSAAEFAAAAISFFPAFTEIGHNVIMELVPPAVPGNFPVNLMLCANSGSSVLSWTDADNSSDLTAGDTASLQFTDCEIDGGGDSLTGAIGFVVNGIDLAATPSSIDLTVSIDLDVDIAPDIITYAASFGVNASTENNSLYTYGYSANDSLGQKLAVAENGTTRFQLGCFNVVQSYSPGSPGTYSLSPGGAINASGKIMSIASGPSPSLVFSNDMIETGTRRLLSISAPGCAAIGTLNGVGDSDGSYIEMEALGGGQVRLHTYNVTDVEIFTTDTTWNLLTD